MNLHRSRDNTQRIYESKKSPTFNIVPTGQRPVTGSNLEELLQIYCTFSGNPSCNKARMNTSSMCKLLLNVLSTVDHYS